MKKIVKLTESDLSRLVEKILNEENKRFGSIGYEVKSKALKLERAMDEYDMLLKRGDERKTSEALEQVKLSFRSLKNFLEEIEKDIRRNS